MTVTELREALQALEAQGRGGLPCVIVVDWKDSRWLDDAEPTLWVVPQGYSEAGAEVVKLG